MQLTAEQILEITKRQYLNFEIKSTEKLKDERAIVHFITTPDVDLIRDVVDPKGGDFAEFEKHKTVFYNHDYNKPIAKNVMLKATAEGVKAKTVFAKTTQQADDIYNLHLEGVISTWSIGFDVARNKNGEIEDEAIDYDDKKRIFYYKKWRLLEYSSAPLAANPNARDQAKAICKSAELQLELKNLDTEQQVTEEMVSKAEFEEIKTLITDIKNASQEDVKKLETELKNVKSKLVHKTAAVSAEVKDRLLKQALSGELSLLTGKKINL